MGILMSSWSWRPESLVVSTGKRGLQKLTQKQSGQFQQRDILCSSNVFLHIAISLDAHILTKGGQAPSAFQCQCCAQVYLHLLQPSALMPWKSFRDWPLAKANRKRPWTLDRWWPLWISDVDWCCGIRGHRGWWERCWESIKWLWRVLL